MQQMMNVFRYFKSYLESLTVVITDAGDFKVITDVETSCKIRNLTFNVKQIQEEVVIQNQNQNQNSLLVTRQMTLFHQGVRMGGGN